MDTDGDGSFATDIFADVISFNHSAGVFGVRREGISAGAGSLKVRLYNNDLQHDVNDFRRQAHPRGLQRGDSLGRAHRRPERAQAPQRHHHD